MKEKILNWVGTDGLLHIICSVIIVSVLNVLLPLWAAGMEFKDRAYGGKWDWLDLIYHAIRWLGRSNLASLSNLSYMERRCIMV